MSYHNAHSASSVNLQGGDRAMTYIENIFICLAIPMLLSLFFTKGSTRTYTIFVIAGMGMCLLSAYVNSFFMGIYRADTTIAAIEITPFCEEVMKLLPLLFFILIFEPDVYKRQVMRRLISG